MAASWLEGLPAPGVYDLDSAHTFVYFGARHRIVGLVRGRFDRVAGTGTGTENPAECSVEVTIDAASLSTQNRVRDEDLLGPDFFAVERYPTATYRGKGIRRVSADTWLLDGTLSIRGNDIVVPLALTYKGTSEVLHGRPSISSFHATAGTRRADFGMTRELIDEIGSASSADTDVMIEIDTELVLRVDKEIA